jgi:prepilin-type N-terminal cleavage/methylation domain-containing protein
MKTSEQSKGFSLIEVLIAMAIFSIGFMAVTTAIWSFSQTSRTTFYMGASIFEGQEFVEYASRLSDLEHFNIPDIGVYGENIEVECNIINETDDFRTLDVRVFQVSPSGDRSMKMRTVCRQKIT